MSSERLCACPCKRSLTGKRKTAKYYSAACRTAAWKHRAGITGIRYVKASQNGKKPSGVQISLGPMERELTQFLRAWGFEDAEQTARAVVLRAVPDRQKSRARAQVERERAA